ncbi:hydroxymethylglutaryl-CoA lyase [Sphingobium sp. H39-3-25]|uniref:hydroxymethylglutaryl-CoA lyase n=1 Tax=Sphingobium arseniciresistens TaxID=3030834 RepID=UPI0023B8B0AF|nr:hydroxymethylglutaryl-CoA lyase [Sphingobium arseniciresistens]
MIRLPTAIELVEVGPRDGLQSVREFVPTATKIELIRQLYDAGIRRMEVTSFVSEAALPQMADAAEIVAVANALAGLDACALVPTVRHAERALVAGTRHLAFVLSASEAHNRSNVRRSPLESADEFARLVETIPDGTRLRVNVATAFDCPMTGRVEAETVLQLLAGLIEIAPGAELALCDTTGRASPLQVASLFEAAKVRFPAADRWAFHGHDTYGAGAANVFAALLAGVRVIDAACAGLGGCPFAPGATGNVATEDVVWMLDGMGIATGIRLADLCRAAERIALVPGAQTGGRVRIALASRACLQPELTA